jgi:N-acetylneuraminic acid mutarotase
MPTPRTNLAAAAGGGRVFALGGRRGSLARNLDVMEAYDPNSQDWKTLASMRVPRSGFSAVSHAGLVYAFGGESKEGTIAEIEVFDPKKNSWSTLTLPMRSPRHDFAAVAWKNRVYTIGGGRRPGFSVSDLNEVLILDDGSER